MGIRQSEGASTSDAPSRYGRLFKKLQAVVALSMSTCGCVNNLKDHDYILSLARGVRDNVKKESLFYSNVPYLPSTDICIISGCALPTLTDLFKEMDIIARFVVPTLPDVLNEMGIMVAGERKREAKKTHKAQHQQKHKHSNG